MGLGYVLDPPFRAGVIVITSPSLILFSCAVLSLWILRGLDISGYYTGLCFSRSSFLFVVLSSSDSYSTRLVAYNCASFICLYLSFVPFVSSSTMFLVGFIITCYNFYPGNLIRTRIFAFS